MTTVEKAKEATPVKTESVSKVSNTLIPTLPHKMVVSRKLESLRIARTLLARGESSSSAAISRRRRVRLKKARLRPENMADCDMQKRIPSQLSVFSMYKVIVEFLPESTKEL